MNNHSIDRQLSNLDIKQSCIAVEKDDGVLRVTNFANDPLDSHKYSITYREYIGQGLYKNSMLVRQIFESELINAFDNFPERIIFLGDTGAKQPVSVLNGDSQNGYISFCTHDETPNDFRFVCPDYTFNMWHQAGYLDYDKFCDLIITAGKQSPTMDAIVWRGYVPNNIIRYNLVKIDNDQEFNFKGYGHGLSESNNDSLDLPFDFTNIDEQFDSFKQKGYDLNIIQQVARYRYLIDVPGVAYSARLKLLLFSQRLIFLVERKCKDYFMEHLEPWVHYVPVKEDLSDLESNFQVIKSNINLEKSIANNAFNFALNNLRYENCLYRWKELLTPWDKGR